MHVLTKSINTASSHVQDLLNEFEHDYLKYIGSSIGDVLPVPSVHLLKKGKRLRPQLFFLAQGMFGDVKPSSMPVAIMIELIHVASLIHDDVIDGSDQRRGQATLNKMFGNHVSVLIGDYLLALSLHLGGEFKNHDVVEELSTVILEMTQSELIKAVRPMSERLSVDHYLECAAGKTGSLFAAACLLGGRLKQVNYETEQQLRQFGNAFGLAFQIQDDILDLAGSPTDMGKPVGQDTDGKQCTLPLILAYKHASESQRFEFFEQISAATEHHKVLKFISSHQGLDLAIRERDKYSDVAERILLRFEPSIYREALENLIQFNRVRNI